EREKNTLGRLVRRAATGDDAQILVIGRHENVARAKMNLVRSQVAFDDQVLVGKRATLGNLEPRDERFEQDLARLGRRRKIAERVALPIIAVAPPWSAVRPVRIVADTGHAHK